MTLCFSNSNSNLSQTKVVVEAESEKSIHWFAFNNMLANPKKFQAIILGIGPTTAVKFSESVTHRYQM